MSCSGKSLKAALRQHENADIRTATYHIFMADTSRISIAGLNEGNVEYFVLAIDETVRFVK